VEGVFGGVVGIEETKEAGRLNCRGSAGVVVVGIRPQTDALHGFVSREKCPHVIGKNGATVVAPQKSLSSVFSQHGNEHDYLKYDDQCLTQIQLSRIQYEGHAKDDYPEQKKKTCNGFHGSTSWKGIGEGSTSTVTRSKTTSMLTGGLPNVLLSVQ